jgi:hypothetical protein
MLSDVQDIIATMRQERDAFHTAITGKTDLLNEKYLEQRVEEICQIEKYDRLNRSYKTLMERNNVLTAENEVLEELNIESDGKLYISEYETYEARRDLRQYKKKIKNDTHDRKISINCALELDHLDFIGYTSGTCEGCEYKRKRWVIMNEKRFEEIQIRTEICTKKELRHDKVVCQLRQLNVSISQRLKELRTNHSKKQVKFERQIKTLKTEATLSTRRLNEFKENFKTRLDKSIFNKINQHNDKKMDLERLINTYQKHTDDIRTLKQYVIIEQFINDTCYERTGVKRDYNSYPIVYNNIRDFAELKGIDSFTREAFGISAVQFGEIFTALKNERVDVAHPTVGEIDIETVQQIVKQRTL